jgi:hypothetical protein
VRKFHLITTPCWVTKKAIPTWRWTTTITPRGLMCSTLLGTR